MAQAFEVIQQKNLLRDFRKLLQAVQQPVDTPLPMQGLAIVNVRRRQLQRVEGFLPVETVAVVDSPADIRVCRFLGDVSPVVQTVPGFTYALEAMKEQTVALGGTHLYLEKRSPDTNVDGSSRTVAPAATARAVTASTSGT